jgi:hypothetical protein
MSRAFFIMTLVTSAAVAAFIVVSAGPTAATSIADIESQIVSSLAMAGWQSPGYMMLAGAKVRDHRSCAPNCGSYNATAGRPGHRPGLNNPPPLATAKPKVVLPGNQPRNPHGGVTVIEKVKRFNIPCYGNAC